MPTAKSTRALRLYATRCLKQGAHLFCWASRICSARCTLACISDLAAAAAAFLFLHTKTRSAHNLQQRLGSVLQPFGCRPAFQHCKLHCLSFSIFSDQSDQYSSLKWILSSCVNQTQLDSMHSVMQEVDAKSPDLTQVTDTGRTSRPRPLLCVPMECMGGKINRSRPLSLCNHTKRIYCAITKGE